jgi:gamma-glutamyl:cysteine ligase YbdK (ATP-grasp superfamily)
VILARVVYLGGTTGGYHSVGELLFTKLPKAGDRIHIASVNEVETFEVLLADLYPGAIDQTCRTPSMTVILGNVPR